MLILLFPPEARIEIQMSLAETLSRLRIAEKHGGKQPNDNFSQKRILFATE